MVASLAGAAHSFTFNKHRVEVRLPKAPKRPPGSTSHWGNDDIYCYTWRAATMKPISYSVSSVEVLVHSKKKLSVAKAAIGTVQTDMHSASRRKLFDTTVAELQILAASALEYWLRVLRWKLDLPALGQLSRSSRETGWSPYLLNEAGKRFWSGKRTIVVSIGKPISKPQWKRLQGELSRERDAPVFVDFFHDGTHRLETGDLAGAVLALAISCETAIRSAFLHHFAPNATSEQAKLLNQVSISRFLDRLHKLGLPQRWSKKIDRAALKRLFEQRNALAHRGGSPSLATAEYKEMCRAARQLVQNTDAFLASP